MCSSLLGLGGTHVQQCSECRISRICVPHSHNFKRNSIAASYQHHAGLQPANLVTSPTVPCSRRSVLFGSVRFVFFSHYFFVSSSILSIFKRSSRISSFFDRLRSNYSTDFLRQLRTVRDISELLIQHDVLYVHVHARFPCPIYSTPLTSVAYRTR